MEGSDVERLKIIMKLARCMSLINHSGEYIDIIEFTKLLHQDDVFMFLGEYNFFTLQQEKIDLLNRDKSHGR